MNRYQFLEIKNVGGTEIAYLLDTQTGKVLRTVVEDFEGGGTKSATVMPKSWGAKTKVVQQVTHTSSDDEVDDISDGKSVVKRPVMMPPALAGVFKPADTPGAAVETRTA